MIREEEEEEEEEEEKEKEAGREWLEIREMKARHLTLFVSQLVNHVNIKQNKKKKKKKATKLIDWQKKRKKRRSATDINKYAFQDLIGLKQTSKQAV